MMKWYNHIFERLGHRRLFTREEFFAQARAEFRSHELRVITRRQHELLLDIAALADICTRHPNEVGLDQGLEAAKRLRTAVMTFKIVQQDQEHPPSTNKEQEGHLMSISPS